MAVLEEKYTTGTGTSYTFVIETSGSKKGNTAVKDSNGRVIGTLTRNSKFEPTALASDDQKRYFSNQNQITSIRNNILTPRIQREPDPTDPNKTLLADDILGSNVDPDRQTSAEADATPVATFDPLTIDSSGALQKKGTFRYPLNLGDNKSQQDYIKFEVVEYVGRTVNKANESGVKVDTSFGERSFKSSAVLSTIILPIQSGISDENSVQWGGENLDAISAYFAGKSFNAMNKGLGKTLEEITRDIANAIDDPNYANAVKIYLAGQAVGTNNLLSRTTGAIINPNLELLFQGPTLRPFNFTFRLSPREEAEATQIKNIIRVFKEASAVRKAKSDLFLKAPYVFKIRYIDGSTKDSNHKSLNLIKECALLSVSVNYTPENTYMTFNDPDHSMVSYELSLRFSELEPITSEDYGTHPIGY